MTIADISCASLQAVSLGVTLWGLGATLSVVHAATPSSTYCAYSLYRAILTFDA